MVLPLVMLKQLKFTQPCYPFQVPSYKLANFVLQVFELNNFQKFFLKKSEALIQNFASWSH